MLRIPGFGVALSTSIGLLLSGCGAAAMKAESAAAPPAPPRATASPAPELESAADERGMVAGAPGIAPSPDGATSAAAPTREMLDIEANASLEVQNVKRAAEALREMAARAAGVVASERVDTSSTHGSAELTLRVPSRAAPSVFRELEKVGKVLDQSVTARDIGKEYFDAKLRLSNLEATLHRYEEILAQATKVEDLLRIEQELGRVRAEIEQIKGNLRWLADRAARATLHVTLRERAPEIAYAPNPEAKLFPGARLPALFDFGKGNQSYLGGGLSLRFSRAASLDLDILKRPSSETRGPDALIATLGGEIYSELLGNGERSYLNPYLGWRIGYARFDHGDQAADQALLGATLGLELFKNRWFSADAEARNYVAFLGDRGPHYLLSPAITARLAF